MTALLTTTGLAHLGELLDGTATTEAFDAMELGAGATPPGDLDVGDDRGDLAAKIGGSIVQVASDYPVLGDADIRNDGRGAAIYSWKFVYPEGVQLIASNAIVTNYDAGAPGATEAIMVHVADPVAKRADQELTVFVNVSQAGAATFVAHVEDGTPLVEQMATWRQQSISLGGAPGASPVTNGLVQSKLGEGEQAWTGARMLNGEGGVMVRDDVAHVLLTALKRDRERDWTVAQETALNVEAVMPAAPVRTDPRWRLTQGYTFSHAWTPPSGWGSRRTRLEYTLTMIAGGTRTLVHEIEWASMRGYLMVAREVIVRGPVWDHLFEPLMRGDWSAFPREQLFEGPAGSSKSMPIGLFLDTVARLYAGVRILVVRKTRVSLTQSWMVTFEEKVLRENDPIHIGATRAHRQSYFYPNGSEIAVGGLDNPMRVLSTEWDIIYCNESTEFSLEDIEMLGGRLRNCRIPAQFMILDCNPDSEFHWLNQRCNDGPTVRRVTRLWHNPAYYGVAGWTSVGAMYRAGLMAGMSGVRYMRLVEGLWVTAEGAIIPIDKALHVLDASVTFPTYKRPQIVVEGWAKPVDVRFFAGAYDHGFRNPGTFQVWAVDDLRRRFLVHQVYEPGRDEDWWSDQIVQADKRYLLHRVVCDSASPEKIVKFNRMLRAARDRGVSDNAPVAIPARKVGANGKTWLEIQAIIMRRAFELDANGAARTFILANSLVGERAPELRGKPAGLFEESVGWTFEKFDPAKHKGQPKEIGDPSKENHSIDAASYFFEWDETHDLPDTAEDRWGQVPPPKGSWAEYELVSKRMREAEQRKKAALWH